MTIEEKRRELFEKWVIEEANRRAYAHLGCVLKRDPIGGYATTWVDMAWLGFSAALDAVVIELPQQWNDDGCGAFYREDGGPHMDAKEVIAAIESTGLGLKVLP